MRILVASTVALVVFVVQALCWTYPLGLKMSTHLTGDHIGDNAQFVWNVWWMRMALARPDVGFFRTDMLFAPFGIDLTLHTHTWLAAFAGATVLRSPPPILAENIWLLASVAANGLSMWALAISRTKDQTAALVAGLVFAGCPYLTAHLLGHYNLIAAWTLPLFCLSLLRTLERQSRADSLGAGLCLAAAAYCDYYYFVYALMLAGFLVITHVSRWRFVTTGAHRSSGSPLLLTGLAVTLLLALAIVATGGFETRVGAVEIRATRPGNLLSLAWVLLAAWLWMRYRPALRITRTGVPLRAVLGFCLPGLLVAGGLLLPLISQALRVIAEGDYVAPAHSWRTGPAGIDLATLFLGNRFHPVWGGAVAGWHDRIGVDRVEGIGWLGVVPAAVIALAFVRRRGDPETRLWLGIGGLFMLWALGPWLRIAGVNTGLLLPQNLASFVPLVSNARMPGRAMVLVTMAAAMVFALFVLSIPEERRMRTAALALVLTLFDYWPSPYPLTPVVVPGIYSALKQAAPGSVCELPLGIRHGMGSVGTFDDRVLLHQIAHGRPIVGGFAARVPASLVARYRELPVVRSFLALSEGREIVTADRDIPPAAAAIALRNAGISLVVLNRPEAPAALANYVTEFLPLRRLASDGTREVYEVVTP